MRRITSKRELVFLHLLLAAPLLLAQLERVRTIDPSHPVLLHGHVSREANLQLDRGPVDASHRIAGISLLLNRTERQQEELEKPLVDQQDPSSPWYHAWLSPEQLLIVSV